MVRTRSRVRSPTMAPKTSQLRCFFFSSMMKEYSFFMAKFLFFIIFGVSMPVYVRAVPPPEFIIQITSQIVPIFGWIFAVLLSGFTVVYQFGREMFTHRYAMFAIGVLVIATVSLGIAYVWDNHMQESQRKEVEQSLGWQQQEYNIDTSKGDETPTIEAQDRGNVFIRSYYQFISDGNLVSAYEYTNKNISFERFETMYKNTSQVYVEKVEKMDETTYSVRVVLHEGEIRTAYGIMMTLSYDALGNPTNIVSSIVTVLGNGAEDITQHDHSITNEEFQKKYSMNPNIFVLDAREQVEYEYGRFPSSAHIKFADLDEAGMWTQVPKDQPVYVLCWSGIRGSMVVDFLRSKGIDAYFLVDGAKGWVDFGGVWEGAVLFGAVYDDVQYSRLFSVSQTKQYVQDGAVLIDSREPSTVQDAPVDGSIPIRIMYTPTAQIDTVLSRVPAQSTVIVICDDYVNCFDARLAGIELERRGYTFLGRVVYTSDLSL